MQGMPSYGHTDSLDDAKREFAAVWRAWLAMHRKDETTHWSLCVCRPRHIAKCSYPACPKHPGLLFRKAGNSQTRGDA